ncbi:MAG TPA: biopolymer transporter ExbD [Flavisolibacter sp.]|nr:biopolymer transporter ExbD [Flavisolibacter sp.]
MATIIEQPISRSKTKKHCVKVDMTPMVDLGFLLITFFIFTTSLAEPTVSKLAMPKQDSISMPVQESKLLTLLLDKQKLFVYEGDWIKAKAAGRVIPSSYDVQNGVGNFIRQKQQVLAQNGAQDELMIAIKPVSSASYQDVLNALDEMQLNGLNRYGIMQISDAEKQFLLSAKR